MPAGRSLLQYNTRNLNLTGLDQYLTGLHLHDGSVATAEELDDQLTTVQEKLQRYIQNTCTRITDSNTYTNDWWTEELETLKTSLRPNDVPTNDTEGQKKTINVTNTTPAYSSTEER